MKGIQDSSPNTRLMITGGSIVTLNIISSNPRIRCTTVQFMCPGTRQMNDTPTWKSFSRLSILRRSVRNRMTWSSVSMTVS